ncbi:MAG: NAD(P)-dependent dehydrogenase (short-subunit alcohol dehydrogenase family) [Halioglobus sp.]
MILEGKTVIVSGVGVGLGREVAKVCLRDGANVMMSARNEERLKTVAQELSPSGDRIAYFATDITASEQCDALVEETKKVFGSVDGLIQVAAREDAWGGLFEADFDKWREAYETNVIGSLSLMRAAALNMKENKSGSIVLIGSQSMFTPTLNQPGYAATKGALLTTARYLAKELGPEGIRVNHVIPSWMWGPNVEMWVEHTAKEQGISKEEALQGIVGEFPLQRMTKDSEVAEATAFFVSDRASAITGQYLLVNSGEMFAQ